MTERLTDEQVAKVLRLASGAMEFDRLHRYDRNSIPEMSILSLSLALLQVSADLSAAKEDAADANASAVQNYGLFVKADADRVEVERALSALQEKARAVIRHTEGMRLVIGESCDTNERAAVVADVRRLRSLLPEEQR